MTGEQEWRPWREAWQQALYGPDGFYRNDEGPAGHFRTAAHASADGALARALAELARRTGCTRVVDVGAGRGELLASLDVVAPDLSLHGVDVVDRPAGLPARIGWSRGLVGPGGLPHIGDTATPTLLVGWELLDVVPCTVLEADRHGLLRTVEVHLDGRERLGPAAPDEVDLSWSRAWWPGPYEPGQRVEVGSAREQVWEALLAGVAEGVVLVVDYDHVRGARPTEGTLTGYRGGRQVTPVPDGRADLTAHVALDALPGSGGHLVRQHEALRWLGLDGRRPDAALAVTDPRAYVTALAAASEAAELLDPTGLGGFGWLVMPVGHASASGLKGLAEWSGNGHNGPPTGRVPSC